MLIKSITLQNRVVAFKLLTGNNPKITFKPYLGILQVSSRKYTPKLGQGQSTVDTFNFQGQGLLLDSI